MIRSSGGWPNRSAGEDISNGHSHPQDETFYALDGEVTAWMSSPTSSITTAFRRGGSANSPNAAVSVWSHSRPAGYRTPFGVESDTARMLFLSTPAGVEDYVRVLAEPARWPWLQPPSAVPRAPAGKIHAVERDLQMIRHGPPPPPPT